VQADTVDAIDHVRQIGNIGAHMEADINVIVDVDPDEAQVLIELAELLFDEWYVNREQRTQRFAQLGLIAADKKQLQQRQKTNAEGGPAASRCAPCRRGRRSPSRRSSVPELLGNPPRRRWAIHCGLNTFIS
jgi:hypothetical protein